MWRGIRHRASGIGKERYLPRLLPCAACLLPLLLTACGFQPIYATHSPAARHLAAVDIRTVTGEEAHIFRNALEDELRPAGKQVDAAPVYALSATLARRFYGLAIQEQGYKTETAVEASATFTLTDTRTGAPVDTVRLRATSGYAVSNEKYADLAAERDAYRRALHDLAARYRVHLQGRLGGGE